MKNGYIIVDDVAYVQLNKGFLTAVDVTDLPKLKAVPYRFHVHYAKNTDSFYAEAVVKCNDKNKTIKLHRFLTDAPKGLVVDHINHDTLDNRRANLRVVGYSQNSLNRKGANRNNSTGHRGISYHKSNRAYSVRATVGKKCIHIGYAPTLELAVAMRQKFLRGCDSK